MKDPRIQRLAEMMVQYSADVQPKQKVLLRGSAVAQPPLLAIYPEVLQAGATPLPMPTLPGAAGHGPTLSLLDL